MLPLRQNKSAPPPSGTIEAALPGTPCTKEVLQVPHWWLSLTTTGTTTPGQPSVPHCDVTSEPSTNPARHNKRTDVAILTRVTD
ncbi:hypothetical protein E2C01_088520 [Portunus trituberculatus]|uniref:Uncharacterized protein n=1 Tax=Portunus trituberculatus TaxID=210409 RepID=A0A5B7JM40_PORTR|nr:hypothetical protein [Portunus trituberculatus]